MTRLIPVLLLLTTVLFASAVLLRAVPGRHSSSTLARDPRVSQAVGQPVATTMPTRPVTSMATVLPPTPAPLPATPTVLASSRPAQTLPRTKYLVMITLDGARPDYLRVSHIPHVRALMHTGTSFTNAFDGILESETPAGHATIASGSNPNRDGILAFNWANSRNVVTNIFDPAKIMNHEMENITSSTGVPTLAGLIKGAQPNARVVALSGSKYYAADAFGGPRADVIMFYHGDSHGHFVPVAVPGHEPPASVLQGPGISAPDTHLPLGSEDHLAMNLAIRSFDTMHQQVTLINMPEFDWPLGHVDGANLDPSAVRMLMHSFDQDLGNLEDAYRRAGVLRNTVFVITADHGFSPIRHVVPESLIQNAVAAAHVPAVENNYTTADYVWLQDNAKANVVASNIAHAENPYIQSVYFKSMGANGPVYLRASGPDLFHVRGVEESNQYLLDSFNGPNGPDVVVFLTEEASTLSSAQTTWKGNHGGADWESQHIPLIISGPGVRSGIVSGSPARLIDLAPTALTLLGVAPTGMDGTPLAEALLHPSASLAERRRAVVSQVSPLVTSMRRESIAELQAGL